MQNEQFGFRPRHSTSLQLVCLIERIIRNFREKWLTSAVFLNLAKAFDIAWIDSLLYKLTLLNFPSYIVHTISSHLRGQTFEASFQTVTSSRPGMQAGVAQWGLISRPLQYALTLAPRRVGPICRRHGHHSHVLQADVACQLPGVLPQ